MIYTESIWTVKNKNIDTSVIKNYVYKWLLKNTLCTPPVLLLLLLFAKNINLKPICFNCYSYLHFFYILYCILDTQIEKKYYLLLIKY